jgi:hypothetical protein
MAALTLADRDTKGAAFTSAAATFLTTLADLAACEQILLNRGAQLDGSSFQAVVGAMSLAEFRHVKYAPTFGNSTAAQLVNARVQALLAAGG